jgi:cytochrome c-type biogenesis protein
VGSDLTIAVAVAAGLISFLSPCVLPLVPGYLGQLTAVAVGRGTATTETRWVAVRHAVAFVLGFGAVFTLLGVTATFAAAGLSPYLGTLRQIGGVLLILLGLNLAGVLRIPALERTWRPLDAGAARSVASATGTVALAPPGPRSSTPAFGDALGGSLVNVRNSWLASLGLGAIFAIGWTPCIGVILGGILMMAAVAQGAILLIAYTFGLGLPFIAIAVLYDRAPALLRPLVAHGRAVSVIGGALVVAIGVAMLMNWLALLPQYVPFNSAV